MFWVAWRSPAGVAQTPGLLTRPETSSQPSPPETRPQSNEWWAKDPQGPSQLGLWMDPGLESRLWHPGLWSVGPVLWRSTPPSRGQWAAVLGRVEGLGLGVGLQKEKNGEEGVLRGGCEGWGGGRGPRAPWRPQLAAEWGPQA